MGRFVSLLAQRNVRPLFVHRELCVQFSSFEFAFLIKEGLNERLEVPLHDALDTRDVLLNTVVGDAILWEVVRSDFL